VAKFNLTFRGKILEGHDREQAKSRLAELFAIHDPARLRQCFSGDLVVLSRDLNRKEAAESYARLRRLGIETELVKLEERNGTRDHKPPAADSTAAVKARAEDQARQQALAREAAHQAKLEAARQAKLETARRKAELAEQKRAAAAEIAQRKAEERRRKEAKRAQRAAEHERTRAAEAARAEEQRAAREAEREQLAQLQRQRREEQQRAAAEKAAAREAQRREQEHKAAQAQLESARRKRQQAAAAAQRKAEELRKRAEEKALAEAAEREQEAQRRAMEQQAEQRAAQELTHISAPPAAGRVKTRLELPSRQRASQADAYSGRRKRQPGEPNLFSLSPFRNTAEVRQRAEVARRRSRRAATAAAISLACGLAMLLGMQSSQHNGFTAGASDIAVAPGQGPLMLAADRLLLHDRAGVGQSVLGAQELGIAALGPPLAFDPEGRLLAPGRLASAAADEQAPTLLRCTLEEPHCELFSAELAGSTINGLVVNPLDGSVFVADSEAGELLKLGSQGELLARAPALLPAQPVLRLDSGLLLVNSAQGPAISVLRYEDDTFGEQLDEISPQASADTANRYRAISDFLPLGEQWWAILERRDGRPAELFRFDRQWHSLGRAQLPSGALAGQLAGWGKRLLVRQPGSLPLLKFNDQGAAEAPLVSTLLTALTEERTRRASLERLAWRAGLALAVLALVASCCLAGLYHIRWQVYSSSREQGAVPLDQGADDITWVAPAANRQQRLSLLARAYAVLALAAVMVAVGLGVSALQLAALLVALAGPAFALLLLQGSEYGHIGIRGDALVLADHQGVYHLGSGSRVHYRSHFLMVDDVTVFIGSRLLPAFDPASIIAQVAPLARRGIHVDRKFLATRLLQGRHPLALGTGIILACGCAALALLSLPGMG
jgi:hypothetical protein